MCHTGHPFTAWLVSFGSLQGQLAETFPEPERRPLPGKSPVSSNSRRNLLALRAVVRAAWKVPLSL